jgi:hypothetical protein
MSLTSCHPPDLVYSSEDYPSWNRTRSDRWRSRRDHVYFSDNSQTVGIKRDLLRILQAINTSTPVNQLPPEILSRVFEHRACERDLVSATQVCLYWRSTLTSAPSLWNCFRFRSACDVDRTLTYLERSKSAPIDVSIDTNFRQGDQVFEHLAPHIARMRSLVVYGPHGIHRASSLLCTNQTLSLQHLEMAFTGTLTHLPDEFLGGYASSLRSIILIKVCPTFQSHFLLPNLVEFRLRLGRNTGSLRACALFRFFSSCTQLQKVQIHVLGEIIQDIPKDQIISLELLVGLDYTGKLINRSLPFLRLPRLTNLRVFLTQPEQVPKLADALPCGGRDLLAGATSMRYYPDRFRSVVKLSGNGVDISLGTATIPDHTAIGWSSGDSWIPFDRVEDLELDGSAAADFPDDIFAFENLRVIRMTLGNPRFLERFLRSLHPDSDMGTPCRSLREIEYAIRDSSESHLRPLVDSARERKRAGHQLGLVCVILRQGCDQGLVEELRLHVGEVRLKR